MNLNNRGWNFLGAFICYQLIITALYFQYVDNLDPCPLCIFQRVLVISLGAILLINAIHNPRIHSWANRIYQILALLPAIGGIIVAGRHVYLQHLPADEVPACGAPLGTLMDYFPLFEVIEKVLAGDGECAKINWNFIGLSMPEWMLVIFITATLVLGFRLFRSFQQPKPY